MLLMIRVNLIGSEKGKKRRSAGPGLGGLPQVPNVGILLFVLGLVLELAVVYSWHTSAAEAADRAHPRLAMKRAELDVLTDRSKSIAALQEEVGKLQATETVFEELFADKSGPVLALSYLAFILHPRNEAEEPAETLKALEAAGWRVAWDPTRAWFLTLRESAGEVTLIGQALAHEDVAEVVRRLESSAYFREVRLEFQVVKDDSRFDGAQLVEFTIKASMVYLIKPVGPEPAVPEAAVAGDGADAGDAGATGDAGDSAGDGPDAGGLGGTSAPLPLVPARAAPGPDATGDADPDAAAGDGDGDASVDAAEAVETAGAAQAGPAPRPGPSPVPAPGAMAGDKLERPPAVGEAPPAADKAAAPVAAPPGEPQTDKSATPQGDKSSDRKAASENPTVEKGE